MPFLIEISSAQNLYTHEKKVKLLEDVNNYYLMIYT